MDRNDTNSPPNSLRVCSYNIHKGFCRNNRNYLLEQVRHAIRMVDADIVFLQEVVGENQKKEATTKGWISGGQLEFLADRSWDHHHYGKNAVYTHGHHGNAILSRYALESAMNTDLSLVPFSRRGVLYTKVFKHTHLFCVHFGLFAFERKSQMKKLISLINSLVTENESIIIAGDFNDWGNRLTEELEVNLDLEEVFFHTHGKVKATYPAFFPLLPMDRIYYRGLKLVESNVLTGEPWKNLSDHCAVYAEFSEQ